MTHKALWDLENGNTVPSADEIAAAKGSGEVDSEAIVEDDSVVITIVDQ